MAGANSPEYQVHKIDLSSASPAGGMTLDGQFGVFRFFRAEDSDGQEVAEALVSVNVQRTATGDEFPLKVGDAIFCPNVSRIRLTWAAHAAVKWAYFLSSAGRDEMEIDARPTLNLVTGAIDIALLQVDTISKRTFIGGSFSTATASKYSGVQLWNPEDSGVNVIVTRATGISDTTRIIMNSNAGDLATEIGGGANKEIGGDASKALIMTDALASPAGTKIAEYMSQSTGPIDFLSPTFPMILAPGKGISFWGASPNITCHAMFEWVERSV